ncbi:hypothetical protein BH23GEM5_BH23GEM5_13500 [soil metagenome]
MLNNLPSASGRQPLANARALLVALLVHAAVAVAIYVSAAVGGSETAAPADPQPQTASTPAPAEPEAGATGDPAAASAGQPAAAATAAATPGQEAIDLAAEPAEPALTQTAVSILIQAPDTMRLGQRYDVLVSLPPILAAPRARNGISPIRQATLAGENVVVDPRTPALQLADSAAPTVWRWTVTPTEPGRSRLAAEVAIVHYRDGAERIASIRGVRKDVHVESTGEQRISRFFAAQWPGLLLLLLLSTIGWLRIRFWR